MDSILWSVTKRGGPFDELIQDSLLLILNSDSEFLITNELE